MAGAARRVAAAVMMGGDLMPLEVGVARTQ